MAATTGRRSSTAMRSVKQPGPSCGYRRHSVESTGGRRQSPGFGGQNLGFGGRQSGTAADAFLGLHTAWAAQLDCDEPRSSDDHTTETDPMITAKRNRARTSIKPKYELSDVPWTFMVEYIELGTRPVALKPLEGQSIGRSVLLNP